MKYLLYPITHTNIQYTVDTIAIDSFEDVREFCLWFNTHCAQLPAALWVPLTVFLFPMGELCCVVVKSNCFEHHVILQRHSLESDLTLSIHIFSLPLTETLMSQKHPCLTCSRVYGRSYRSIQPVGAPGFITLAPLLIPQELNVGIAVMKTWYL